MILEITSATRLALGPLVISVGNFDGVHLGHQLILKELLRISRESSLTPAILTFPQHPLALIDPVRTPQRLTTLPEKLGLLAQAGVLLTLVWEFTPEFASLIPEQFLKDVLKGQLAVRHLIIGHDHTFGKDRSGDWHLVEKLAPELGLEVDYVDALYDNGHPISSSYLRKTLLDGDIKHANKMLGYNFTLTSQVVPGRGEGKVLGFPTANLAPTLKLTPKSGVYAGWAFWGRYRFPAAINISFAKGIRGTVQPISQESYHQVVEAHLVGFEGDLVGKQLRLEFVTKVREELSFSSRTELIAQIGRDVEAVSTILARHENGE